MEERVQILLATYQGAAYLKEQLQSLMQQSYPHFHILIRDDGSTDGTLTIIDSFRRTYPERFSVLPSHERLGAKKSFSELMGHATANYVMFCDQDDIWLPHKIEKSLLKIKEMENQYGRHIPLLMHTDLQVVASNLTMIDPSFWRYSHINPTLTNLNRLLVQNILTGCAVMMNRKLLELAYPIPQAAIMHDWWLGLVASALGKIDFIAQPTLLYRQHNKNDIGAKNWKSMKTYLTYAKQVFHELGRQELHERLMRTIHQASAFLDQYESYLEPQQKQIVQNYVMLKQVNAMKKRYLIFKHRYFKNTLAKSIGMVLFISGK